MFGCAACLQWHFFEKWYHSRRYAWGGTQQSGNHPLSQLLFFRSAKSPVAELTLPSLKAWGFLIHRLTFKHHVLAAVLKPFNRTIVQIDESNSQ